MGTNLNFFGSVWGGGDEEGRKGPGLCGFTGLALVLPCSFSHSLSYRDFINVSSDSMINLSKQLPAGGSYSGFVKSPISYFMYSMTYLSS